MKAGIVLAVLAAIVGAWSVAAIAGDDAFVPPPGFVTKKRGAFTLYCKRDTTIGTRIKTEKCYDEQQVRDYLLAMKQAEEDAARIRNTCANVCVCGSPDLCNESIRQPRR
jgi:hypothetical protein